MNALLALPFALLLAPSTPKVGDRVPLFRLDSVAGPKVDLGRVMKKGPVVLVILRGFPGYQCPLCTVQVGDLLKSAEVIKAAGAQVVMVYPGPAQDLKLRAAEFVKDKGLPSHFSVGVDPDYRVVNQLSLRWDAPNETAYPSTFVVGRNGKVKFAKTSSGHGDRASAKDVLAALNAPDVR